ncbi:MAG: hypothetical protein MK226_12300 [Saprospiraceae bacterium]|nr:hypothetical protein [Saprospiraceae bacterium]
MYKTPVLWSFIGLLCSFHFAKAQADITTDTSLIEKVVEIPATIEKNPLAITLEDLQSSNFSGCIPDNFKIIKTKLSRNIATGDFNKDGIQDLVALVQTPPNKKTIKLVIFERDTAGLCPNPVESLNLTMDLIADETFSQVKSINEDQIFFKYHSSKYNVELYLGWDEKKEAYSILRSNYIIHPNSDYPDGEIISKDFLNGLARIMPKEGTKKQVVEERIPARTVPISSIGKKELREVIRMD